MARNLSWIDPEKLASLLDVVSPAPQRVAGDDSPQDFDSALFAATYTVEPVREPASRPASNTVPNRPAARPAAAAPATRPAMAEPPAGASARRAIAPAPPPATPVGVRVVPAPSAAARAEAARQASAKSSPGRVVPAVAPARPAPAVAPAAPAAAPETALPAAPAPRPAISGFQPDPRADLADQLAAFLDWVVSATRSQGAFITDANGLVVVERRANRVEECMTASIDLMLNHIADVIPGDLGGHVMFHRDGLHLVTLWTPSKYGRFFGVLIGETAPPQESIALAGQGLRTLFTN